MQRLYGFAGFFGFFGLIGFAFMIEFRQHRKTGRITPSPSNFTTPPSFFPPAVAFGFLYAAFLLFLWQSQSLLPDPVASHFGADGLANDWMSRKAYNLFCAAMPLAVAGFMWFTGLLTGILPASLVNIPRKDYWLAPQNRATTARFLQRRLLWLACLILLLFAAMHYATIKANSLTPPRLPMDLFIVTLIGFLLSLIVWIVALLMHLREPPQSKSENNPAFPV